MNTRRESLFSRMITRMVLDPVLSSGVVQKGMKQRREGDSGLASFVLRNLLDPTTLPPPGYVRHRADAVYGEVFRRSFEYLAGSRVSGDIVEFGTFLGYTARWIAGFMRESREERRLWLYDSFEGLPDVEGVDDCYEVVEGVWCRGAMRIDPTIHVRIGQRLAKILPAERLNVVKGFFEDTLHGNLPQKPVALVHLDCDLYSSSRTVLDALMERDLLQDGTVLICDDFNCSRANPNMGERRALAEVFDADARFNLSPWFSYGWHGQVFFVHDRQTNSGRSQREALFAGAT